MQRHELEHLIRAAARITDEYEFVVVGSQSILGSLDRPPAECVLSNEADIFPMNSEGKADLIDGAIGEGSQFHETYGYYAQGVDSTTAVLPAGWRDRLVRVQSEQTEGRVGFCAANREKDRVFNRALLAHGHVKVDMALERLPVMPLNDARKADIAILIWRLAGEAGI